MTIQELMDISYRIASDKGFHDAPRAFPTTLALIHSEVSEALEWYRLGKYPFDNEISEEFADIMIRVADTAKEFGIDLQAAILRKIAINEKRERLHGKVL